MRSVISVLAILTAFCIPAVAQITIEQADMPSAGDTIRVSRTINIPVDYTKTGADTAWDFSMLESMNQQLDTFVSMNTVPVLYRLVFIPDIVANLASPRAINLALPGFALTDSYFFYKKNALGFSEAGYAFTFAGIPVPMKYDVADLYYAFPMSYDSSWNSSSHAELSMPGLAYLGSTRIRSSEVDGWGALTTPYGTFETLRVKTSLQENDSIYIDSLNLGIPMNRQITQYTWLGKQQGEPLLQVNVEAGTATATYRDIFRQQAIPMTVSLGPDTSVQKGHQITLTPVITGGTPPFQYLWSTFDTSASITLTIDTAIQVGVAVLDVFNNAGFDLINITVKNAPGVQEHAQPALGIHPNPSSGELFVDIPKPWEPVTIRVSDATGKQVRIFTQERPGKVYQVSIAGLPQGIYSVTLEQEGILLSGRAILLHE